MLNRLTVIAARCCHLVGNHSSFWKNGIDLDSPALTERWRSFARRRLLLLLWRAWYAAAGVSLLNDFSGRVLLRLRVRSAYAPIRGEWVFPSPLHPGPETFHCINEIALTGWGLALSLDYTYEYFFDSEPTLTRFSGNFRLPQRGDRSLCDVEMSWRHGGVSPLPAVALTLVPGLHSRYEVEGEGADLLTRTCVTS